jgi:hypothetical protein
VSSSRRIGASSSTTRTVTGLALMTEDPQELAT